MWNYYEFKLLSKHQDLSGTYYKLSSITNFKWNLLQHHHLHFIKVITKITRDKGQTELVWPGPRLNSASQVWSVCPPVHSHIVLIITFPIIRVFQCLSACCNIGYFVNHGDKEVKWIPRCHPGVIPDWCCNGSLMPLPCRVLSPWQIKTQGE